jgi:hypothetical protein
MCNVRISIPTIDYLNGTLTGIRWNFTTKVEDLDFALDLALPIASLFFSLLFLLLFVF